MCSRISQIACACSVTALTIRRMIMLPMLDHVVVVDVVVAAFAVGELEGEAAATGEVLELDAVGCLPICGLFCCALGLREERSSCSCSCRVGEGTILPLGIGASAAPNGVDELCTITSGVDLAERSGGFARSCFTVVARVMRLAVSVSSAIVKIPMKL